MIVVLVGVRTLQKFTSLYCGKPWKKVHATENISPKRKKKKDWSTILFSKVLKTTKKERETSNYVHCSSNPHYTSLYIHSSSYVTLCLPEFSLNHESLHNHIKMNIENVSKMCDSQTHWIVFKVYSDVHTSIVSVLRDKCSAFLIFWWLIHLLRMRTQSSFPARHCSKWQC